MTSQTAAAEQNVAANDSSKTEKKTRRWLFYPSVMVVAIFILNILWLNSGDNQWVLEKDEDGTQVYSMKTPGSYVKQFKAIMIGEYSLSHLVAGLKENSTMDNCKNHIPDCVDVKVIEPWSDATMSDTVMWTLGLPEPLARREIVIQSFVKQDPETKVVTIDVIAAPNKIARNQGAVRLSYMQNRWRYTPLGDGKVEIEFMQDMDMGGLMPDILLNLAGVDETYKFIHEQLPGLLDRPGFKTIKYDFIEEL